MKNVTRVLALFVIGFAATEVADAAALASVSIRGSLAVAQPEAVDVESESPVAGVAWKTLIIGILIGVVVVGAGVGAFMFFRKKPEPEAEETPLTKAQEEAATDYAAMLKSMAQKVAQDVGPKLSKGGAVRNVLNKRMSNFQDKAKNFLLSEMNGTAGAVLKEIEAEEAMLLLDWNNAVEANFPPLSILLAGIMSPTTLNLMAGHHSVQAFTVGLPMFILCIVAMYIDRDSVCSIPTIFAWIYTQTFLAACMFFGHLILLAKCRSGKTQVDKKAEEMQERMSHTADGSISQMREQVVGNLVVLQEALLIENGIRASVWNIIVGLATIGWVTTTIWNLVLICGWTFVPGVVAFHHAAAGHGDYCGSWMTIVVLRISTLLSVLYFFINMATVIQFVCDMMIESSSFHEAVLGKAREIDKNSVGVPVVELLAKAFLLRGGSDTLNSKLAVVQHHKYCLEKEKKELESKLSSVETRYSAAKDEEESLQEQAKQGGDLAAQCRKVQEAADGSEDLLAEWKKNGQVSIEDAQAKAQEIREATTKDLERLYEKISEAANAATEYVESTEAFKALDAKLHQWKDILTDPKLREEMMNELAMLKDKAVQAASQAKDLADEAIKLAKDPKLQEELQRAATEAMDKAKAAAQKIADTVNDPELQAQLQEEAQKAFEMAKQKAHEAADAIEDPELQEKLKKAATEAVEKVQESAIQTAAGVKAAAEDPELQAKIKAQVEAAEAKAQAAAKDVQSKLKK